MSIILEELDRLDIDELKNLAYQQHDQCPPALTNFRTALETSQLMTTLSEDIFDLNYSQFEKLKWIFQIYLRCSEIPLEENALLDSIIDNGKQKFGDNSELEESVLEEILSCELPSENLTEEESQKAQTPVTTSNEIDLTSPLYPPPPEFSFDELERYFDELKQHNVAEVMNRFLKQLSDQSAQRSIALWYRYPVIQDYFKWDNYSDVTVLKFLKLAYQYKKCDIIEKLFNVDKIIAQKPRELFKSITYILKSQHQPTINKLLKAKIENGNVLEWYLKYYRSYNSEKHIFTTISKAISQSGNEDAQKFLKNFFNQKTTITTANPTINTSNQTINTSNQNPEPIQNYLSKLVPQHLKPIEKVVTSKPVSIPLFSSTSPIFNQALKMLEKPKNPSRPIPVQTVTRANLKPTTTIQKSTLTNEKLTDLLQRLGHASNKRSLPSETPPSGPGSPKRQKSS